MSSYQQFTGRYAIFFGVFAKTVGEVTEAITHTAAQTGKALVRQQLRWVRELGNRHTID